MLDYKEIEAKAFKELWHITEQHGPLDFSEIRAGAMDDVSREVRLLVQIVDLCEEVERLTVEAERKKAEVDKDAVVEKLRRDVGRLEREALGLQYQAHYDADAFRSLTDSIRTIANIVSLDTSCWGGMYDPKGTVEGAAALAEKHRQALADLDKARADITRLEAEAKKRGDLLIYWQCLETGNDVAKRTNREVAVKFNQHIFMVPAGGVAPEN